MKETTEKSSVKETSEKPVLKRSGDKGKGLLTRLSQKLHRRSTNTEPEATEKPKSFTSWVTGVVRRVRSRSSTQNTYLGSGAADDSVLESKSGNTAAFPGRSRAFSHPLPLTPPEDTKYPARSFSVRMESGSKSKSAGVFHMHQKWETPEEHEEEKSPLLSD